MTSAGSIVPASPERLDLQSSPLVLTKRLSVETTYILPPTYTRTPHHSFDKMSTVSILYSDARPQAASPLFTRLPPELRLMIYDFVFKDCQTTAWFDAEYGVGHRTRWERRWERRRLAKDGQFCFEHSEGDWGCRGAFDLLVTCRMAYIEAFKVYWSHTVLTVKRHLPPRACYLQQVCAYLPPEIKSSLRHLRNTKLPICGKAREMCDDPYQTPTLLQQFPRLVSCALNVRQTLPARTLLPDGDNVDSKHMRVGCFEMKKSKGVTPADYIESRIGVQPSSGVMILSASRGGWLPWHSKKHKPRVSLLSMYVSHTNIRYAHTRFVLVSVLELDHGDVLRVSQTPAI